MNVSEVSVASIANRSRHGPLDLLLLAAWCGPMAGGLEVLARVGLGLSGRLYLVTRHFVWVVPILDAAIFAVLGLACAAAARIWPRSAWASTRLLIALAILPALMIAGPGVLAEAWMLLALGIAFQVAPWLEREPSTWRRRGRRAWPVLPLVIAAAGGWVVGSDRLAEWRESWRPIPTPRPPNVLLVVLDTVRADRLSLYGYTRPTSPTLVELSRRGIRFDQARSSAPWTLASHATILTGQWPHDVNARWLTSIQGGFPTLAGFLGGLGYTTAGFVANTIYCSYDSGLARDFGHYEDHVFRDSATLRASRLFEMGVNLVGWVAPGWTIRQLQVGDRKDASIINRELLGWLDRRSEPDRPFFAFLNYVDAHAPYVLPMGVSYQFGDGPRTEGEYFFLLDGWIHTDREKLPPPALTMARNAYDDCLAYLDAQLGKLFDELKRRGELDRTLIVVVADHGEGLGEHGLYDHGESLYQTEIHVPLVIVPPGGRTSPSVVREVVSLRDLPATIAELAAPGARSPFPGRSLSRTWAPQPTAPGPNASPVFSELTEPNPIDPNQGRAPVRRGPLTAIAQGDYVLIRNAGDGREELYNERDDPHELIDQSRSPAMAPVVGRLRGVLDRLTPAQPGR